MWTISVFLAAGPLKLFPLSSYTFILFRDFLPYIVRMLESIPPCPIPLHKDIFAGSIPAVVVEWVNWGTSHTTLPEIFLTLSFSLFLLVGILRHRGSPGMKLTCLVRTASYLGHTAAVLFDFPSGGCIYLWLVSPVLEMHIPFTIVFCSPLP